MSDIRPDRPPLIEPDAATLDADTRRKRRRFAVITWLGTALVLVLALVASSPYWAPPLAGVLPGGASSAPSAAPADLTSRLDADEARLRRVEERLTGEAPPAAAASGLAMIAPWIEERAAADLDARLKALEAGAPNADTLKRLDQVSRATETMLDQLQERLTSLETKFANTSDNPERLLLVSLSALSAAIESSRPFTGELATSEALAVGHGDIETLLKPLDADATAGLPSTALLARQFSFGIAPAILRQQAENPAPDQPWWRRILAKLRGLVVIRRVDEAGAPTGDPIASGVTTAEAALDKGDLAGTVAAVEALPASDQIPAQAWLAEAHCRLAAEAAIAQATQNLAGALTAAPATPPPAPAKPTP